MANVAHSGYVMATTFSTHVEKWLIKQIGWWRGGEQQRCRPVDVVAVWHIVDFNDGKHHVSDVLELGVVTPRSS